MARRGIPIVHDKICHQHKTLRVSPAMAASLTDELLSMEHLCTIMDAASPAKKRGAYKQRAA
ncbi:MAG TPA: hypothetical protein VMD53_19515 [Rhizomicrobium sp.]|nr:hypothetical protein [Rhizomicrobium sp.]